MALVMKRAQSMLMLPTVQLQVSTSVCNTQHPTRFNRKILSAFWRPGRNACFCKPYLSPNLPVTQKLTPKGTPQRLHCSAPMGENNRSISEGMECRQCSMQFVRQAIQLLMLGWSGLATLNKAYVLYVHAAYAEKRFLRFRPDALDAKGTVHVCSD